MTLAVKIAVEKRTESGIQGGKNENSLIFPTYNNALKHKDLKNQIQVHIQGWKVLLKRVIKDRLLEKLNLTVLKKLNLPKINPNNINFKNATKQTKRQKQIRIIMLKKIPYRFLNWELTMTMGKQRQTSSYFKIISKI